MCLRTSKHGQARSDDDELAGRSPSLGNWAFCGHIHIACRGRQAGFRSRHPISFEIMDET